MNRSDGRVASVTGGVRGIGRTTCEACAHEGANVIVADVLETDAPDTAQAIGSMAIMVNVADTPSVQAGAVAVEVAWGGMDIPVSNAGDFNMASIDRITPEDCRRRCDVNVGGNWMN